MGPELIALVMFGLLLLGLFMGHPLSFVLGGTAVLGALIAGKPMVLGIVVNRIFGDVLSNFTLIGTSGSPVALSALPSSRESTPCEMLEVKAEKSQ